MRNVVRVTVVVLGLLGGVPWSAANACVLADEPAPAPVETDGSMELDAGAAMLLGLTAFAATRRPVARRIPSSP